MNLIERILRPTHVAYGHCDLFCGVYDPAQAKIEAMEKAGITVVRNLGELGKTTAEVMGM